MGMQSRGIDETRQLLRGIADRAGDLRPVWPVVGDAVAGEARRLFLSGGARGGAPWAALNADYRRWKVAHSFDERRLIKTGAMMRSLSSRPMDIERYGATWAEFGTTDPKLHWHEDGTRKMPARPVIKPLADIVFRRDPVKTRLRQVIVAHIVRD